MVVPQEPPKLVIFSRKTIVFWSHQFRKHPFLESVEIWTWSPCEKQAAVGWPHAAGCRVCSCRCWPNSEATRGNSSELIHISWQFPPFGFGSTNILELFRLKTVLGFNDFNNISGYLKHPFRASSPVCQSCLDHPARRCISILPQGFWKALRCYTETSGVLIRNKCLQLSPFDPVGKIMWRTFGWRPWTEEVLSGDIAE